MKPNRLLFLTLVAILFVGCWKDDGWQADFLLAQQLEEERDTRLAKKKALSALKKATDAFGDKDLRTAQTKVLVGRLLRKSFATREAKEYLLQAYSILEYQKNKPLVLAQCCFELGWVHYLLAEMDEAQKLLDKALTLRKDKLADQHEDVIDTIAKLAAVFSYQKDFKKANELYGRALELTEQSFGRSSSEAAELLNDMAENYMRQNSHRARECLTRALAIRESLFHRGDAKSEVKLLSTIDELLSLLLASGKRKESIALLERKIEITGPRSLLSCGDSEKLGTLHLEDKDYVRAERAYLLSLQNLERAFGKNDEKCFGPMEKLIILYDEWGKKEKASALKKRIAVKGKR